MFIIGELGDEEHPLVEVDEGGADEALSLSDLEGDGEEGLIHFAILYELLFVLALLHELLSISIFNLSFQLIAYASRLLKSGNLVAIGGR